MRAPARLRCELNAAAVSRLQGSVIDAESIEALFFAVTKTFIKYPHCEPSRTALKAIVAVDFHGERHNLLSSAFSALPQRQQQVICDTAKVLLARSGQELKCAVLFKEIASAVELPGRATSQIHDLLVSYLVALGHLWRAHGLKVTRRYSIGRVGGPSRFHRFAELVLTGVLEPNSNRHLVPERNILAQARSAHARIPKSERRNFSASARRIDTQWLISDDHVKKAIIALKKRP
jgi:hypothetical protein